MGRIEFAQENKVATVNYDYPKFRLKKGEKARIQVGLESPVAEYVHTVRKPVIVNGKPEREAVTNPRTNKTTMELKKEFMGKPLCIGDPAVLATKAIDPKNCPLCALAAKSADYTAPPQRRFAMHVFKYRVKSGSFDVANPFGGELLVWGFTDKMFNKIADFREDFGGDLRKHDLNLGPCTNEDFQQFDVTPSLTAEWLKDKDRLEYVKTTFRENQIEDLTIACGSPKQKSWMEEDAQTVLETWAEVKAAESTGSGTSTSLDTDLSALLDDDKAPAKDADGWSAEGPSAEDGAVDDGLDALLGGSDTTADATPSAADDDLSALLNGSDEPEAPAAETAPAAADAGPASDNFDDLLADMK